MWTKWAATWQNQQNECAPSEDSISLGIRPVWSESSLSAWRNLGSLATYWVHSEDSDHWAHTHFVSFVTRRLKYLLFTVSEAVICDSRTWQYLSEISWCYRNIWLPLKPLLGNKLHATFIFVPVTFKLACLNYTKCRKKKLFGKRNWAILVL